MSKIPTVLRNITSDEKTTLLLPRETTFKHLHQLLGKSVRFLVDESERPADRNEDENIFEENFQGDVKVIEYVEIVVQKLTGTRRVCSSWRLTENIQKMKNATEIDHEFVLKDKKSEKVKKNSEIGCITLKSHEKALSDNPPFFADSLNAKAPHIFVSSHKNSLILCNKCSPILTDQIICGNSQFIVFCEKVIKSDLLDCKNSQKCPESATSNDQKAIYYELPEHTRISGPEIFTGNISHAINQENTIYFISDDKLHKIVDEKANPILNFGTSDLLDFNVINNSMFVLKQKSGHIQLISIDLTKSETDDNKSLLFSSLFPFKGSLFHDNHVYIFSQFELIKICTIDSDRRKVHRSVFDEEIVGIGCVNSQILIYTTQKVYLNE